MSDNCNKQRSPFTYIVTFAWMGILIFLITFVSVPFTGENKLLVQLNEGTTLSQDEILQLAASPTFSYVYPYARVQDSLETTGSRSVRGVIYQVMPEYFQKVPLTMVNGRVLWAEDVGRQFIVLSDTLAIALLGNKDVVGEVVAVNEEAYTIIGIYEQALAFPANLAYYGEDIAYVLQNPAAPLKATHIEAALIAPGQGSLGLKWLEQFPAVGSNMAASHNLCQSWKNLKLIARGFICLYGFLLWRLAFRKLRPIYVRSKDLVKGDWQQHYALAAIKSSFKPLMLAVLLCVVMVLGLVGLAAILLAGISVPSEYIPTKFLFQQIKDAFFVYVNNANTRISIAHPLVALTSWWRMLLMALGITGSLMLIHLRKKWEMSL